MKFTVEIECDVPEFDKDNAEAEIKWIITENVIRSLDRGIFSHRTNGALRLQIGHIDLFNINGNVVGHAGIKE